jgi:RNA polymerase sigma-70 factor (ECF subfamily)
MSDSSRELLRRLLLLDYDGLKARLARRLGSAERASDALQETWLRLERAAPVGAVRRPQPYLLRIAYNIALKRRQAERETTTLDDARAALNLVDEAPDPARVVEAKSEVAALERALAELSPRRRAILLASRVERVALSELATRYGVSQRMVEIDLKLALIHCGRRMGRKIVQRFGPRSPEGSDSKKNDPQ